VSSLQSGLGGGGGQRAKGIRDRVKASILLVGLLTVLTFAADQGTKVWARHHLREAPPLTLIEGYLALEYHENPGVAFGLLRSVPGARYFLIGVGLIALVAVWLIIRRVKHRRGMAYVAFALIAGGAMGNLWDRVYLGRVVDFIVMHYQHKFTWPAYNIADVVLVIGVGLLILVFGRKQELSATTNVLRQKPTQRKPLGKRRKK
jgi:signal peptidase II